MKKLSALLLVTVACGGTDPGSYVDEYGGLESQYEAISTSDDCQWLSDTAADMDARYDQDRDRVALGYQRAAVDRMTEVCD